MPDRGLGLYLHIPFCRSKCAYCDFYSLPSGEETMERYAGALSHQLSRWGEKLGCRRVDTVYFGGGTPSWFGAERICRVLERVEKTFALTADCEITMEANPDSVTLEGLRALRRAGVNRLSMGVQSASEEELRAVGRPHTFDQAARSVELARQAGFFNLSLDLIYGLPGQTKKGWLDNLAAVMALEPEHLSCYGLKLEEGTPLWQRQGEYVFPDEDEQAEYYLAGVAAMEAEGYLQYEISNFARPGYHSRHNLKYWTLEEYLGLGPAAHSDLGGVRFGYARDLEGYLAAGEGQPPLSEWAEISPAERAEEYVMLGLRLTRGISREEYEIRSGASFGPLAEKLNTFAAHGLARERGGRWALTPSGMLVSNAMIGALLEDC